MSSSVSKDRAPFPRDQADFPSDPRISFSLSAATYVLKDERGKTWEWIANVQNWTEAIDEAQIAQQSEAYSANFQPDRKRKAPVEEESQSDVKQKPEQSSKPDRAPTAVYVTSLPLDATKNEIHEVFARFGVIAESLETSEWRIKMYQDDDGNFKGEALVVYHRPESVPNAILMLDGTDFRLGESQNVKMSVKIADSSYKRQKDDQNNAPRGPRRPIDRAAEQTKKKAKLKFAEMNSRLGDWSSDEEPQTVPSGPRASAKTLVLKSMFTLAGIKQNPEEILEIKEDIRDECEKLGTVTNVVLYDKEEDGVVTVRFSSVDAAATAAEKFNGRKFDGQTVVAYVSEGRERFRKSGKDEDAIAERERLERLANDVSQDQ